MQSTWKYLSIWSESAARGILCLLTGLTSHSGTSSLNASPQPPQSFSAVAQQELKWHGNISPHKWGTLTLSQSSVVSWRYPSMQRGWQVTVVDGSWVSSKTKQSSQEETEEGARDSEKKVLFSLREVWKLLFVVETIRQGSRLLFSTVKLVFTDSQSPERASAKISPVIRLKRLQYENLWICENSFCQSEMSLISPHVCELRLLQISSSTAVAAVSLQPYRQNISSPVSPVLTFSIFILNNNINTHFTSTFFHISAETGCFTQSDIIHWDTGHKVKPKCVWSDNTEEEHRTLCWFML